MNLKTVLTALGWSAALCSIVLQVLYTSSGTALLWYHYILLFLVSVLGGIAITDLKDVIFSYFIVFPLSLFTMIFIMGLLPGILNKVQSGSMGQELVTSMAINMIVRTTFPSVWVLCLLGAIVGCGIGEKTEVVPETIDAA